MLAALAPARRRLVLGLIALLVAAIVTVVVVLIASPGGHRSIVPLVADRPGPVLLVPGYGGAVGGLNALASRLREDGRRVQVVHLPDNGQGDLRVQARALADAATGALAASSARTVDVVGYSAGGVVARLWAREDGGAAVARRIVTLGSPQHGTQLAGLGALVPDACPPACEQLAPGSDLLAELNSGDETPNGPSFVSIWTTRDRIVLPPDSARLAGALNLTVQSVCSASTVSHERLPTDPLVQNMVIAELGAGAPVALTAQDCARLSS